MLRNGLQYFSTVFLTDTIFRINNFGHKMCISFSLQIFSEIFPIIRNVEGELIKNIHKSSCQSAVFLARFTRNLNFLTDFRKIFKYQKSRNSFQCEPICSMCTDGRTDMTKLNSLFSQFDARNKEPFVSNFSSTT